MLGLVFAIIDYSRVSKDKSPIFVVEYQRKNDLKIVYYGLGYKIVSYKINYNPKIRSEVYTKFGFWFYSWKLKVKTSNLNSISKINLKEVSNCEKDIKLYFKFKDRKVYLNCLDGIEVISEGIKGSYTYELSQYLDLNPSAIEEIISKFTKGFDPLNDGGSTYYYGTNLIILKCRTLLGNNDIYIGSKLAGASCQ